MSNTLKINVCPKCGAPIPAGAPQGLCPKCVLIAAATAEDPAPPETATSEIPSLSRVAAAFPNLEVLELIGRGGMGFVFKARQPQLDRFVALKLLPDKLARDPLFAERFNREGRVLARLNHPNIVSVYDFGMTEHFYYLTMEFVEGVNLRQAMQAGRFSPAEALRVVPKICEALQYAHEKGILHRDIKPANILLDLNGQVKIADFGIAKLVGEEQPDVTLTATGAALGTPHYMAPEQLENPTEVDHRADIYSLGVVFYEMLTGELPIGRFAAPSSKTPVGSSVDEVVFRTLEKDRERRYQSAGEMKTQVEHLEAGQEPAATISAGETRFSRWSILKWVFIGLLVAGLGVEMASFTDHQPNSRPEAQKAVVPFESAVETRTLRQPIVANFRLAKGQVATLEILNRDNDTAEPISDFIGYAVAPDDERARFSLMLMATEPFAPATNLTAWRLSLVTEDGATVAGGVAALGDLIPNLPTNYLHSIEPGSSSELMLTRPDGSGAATRAPHAVLSLRIGSQSRGNIGGPQVATTIGAGATNWAPVLQHQAAIPGRRPRPGEVLAHQWLKSPVGTNTTNTIRFTFTNVELVLEDGCEWLAMDYATDIRGNCEVVFRLDGDFLETRKRGLLVTPDDSPAVLRQRFQWKIPSNTDRSVVTELTKAFAEALVGKSFVIPEGEQRPLLRFPVGTKNFVSVGIGARLVDASP